MSKTAKGLVEYCKAQLGRPYWWGCFGQIASASLLDAKRKQYPNQYKSTDFSSQYGVKVHDCCGLIKGYLWSDTPDTPAKYNRSQDVAVDGLFRHCSRHGDISSLPEVPGTCVFRGDMGHVGVYIGGGQVIEARGHAYGVVESRLQDGNWTKWGQPDWIDYSDVQEIPEPMPQPVPTTTPQKPTGNLCTVNVSMKLPVLHSGSRGNAVRLLQYLLQSKGYDIGHWGIDGHFGGSTATAVKNAQRDTGLSADGIVGIDTWTVLLR